MTRDNESRDIIHMSKETYLRVKWDLQVKRDICTWSCWLAQSMTRDNESTDIMHMSEETYLRVKRDRWTSQKRPMYMILLASTVHDSRQRVNRHHAHVKQTRQITFQKRPIHMSKETYMHVKKGMYTCETRRIYRRFHEARSMTQNDMSAETICMSKETYLHVKRD